MPRDENWRADRARYPRKAPLQEVSYWSVRVYRFGRRIEGRRGPWGKLQHLAYWAAFRVTETLFGIGIPKDCDIGPGLRIWHFGGIFLHPATRIGANCTLRQGVTIGNAHAGGGAPVIGNDVEIGAYAQIIGAVVIGDRARIGAAAVVVKDVPADATVVGNPARVVTPRPRAAAPPPTGD